MNGLFFVVLIILSKDINVCSVENKGEKFQWNEFFFFYFGQILLCCR